LSDIINFPGQNRREKLKEMARDIISRRPPTIKPKLSMKWVILALIVTLIFLTHRGVNFISVDNGGSYHVGDIININKYFTKYTTNADGRKLRKWSELSKAERKQIKAETLKKFPDIRNIGDGVNWQPIAEWLAKEKNLSHANPRDLFREYQ
jgi:hypothetical protein